MTAADTTIHVWGYAEGCPACTKLKALLDHLKAPYVFHAIDRNSPERAALKDAGFATVPQMFDANGLHMGDFGDAVRNAMEGILTGLPVYGETIPYQKP